MGRYTKKYRKNSKKVFAKDHKFLKMLIFNEQNKNKPVVINITTFNCQFLAYIPDQKIVDNYILNKNSTETSNVSGIRDFYKSFTEPTLDNKINIEHNSN